MVLNVCHTSVSFKMDDAAKSLSALTLETFAGENVSKFANEAQHLIKIMKGGYVLPYQLGSQLIQKVCATQSQYFNRSMFNLLDNALAIEKAHGPHRDPKLLEKDPLYVKYGPLGLCVDMREKYSDLVTINNWPALSAVIPQANLGEVPQNVSESSGGRKNPNGFKCHECDLEYHLRNNCPVKKNDLLRTERRETVVVQVMVTGMVQM